MAAVRRMIARRCPRARERYQEGRESQVVPVETKPTPVVAANRSQRPERLTALDQQVRSFCKGAVRTFNSFLIFITGDHWTSVLAAWVLVLSTVLCIALLIVALGKAEHTLGEREL